jgi:hypothetical protein
MHGMMGLVSAQLLIAVIPAAAEPRCAEMPLLQTLEAEAKAGKPASEVVEALLRDAEKSIRKAPKSSRGDRERKGQAIRSSTGTFVL